MEIFFDTEFTGLHKDTTLISIGLVDSYGNKFYGVCTDYDKSQVNDWIRDNVLSSLSISKGNSDPAITNVQGDKEFVGASLKQWLDKYDRVTFVSDVAHYDMVLLIDLVYGNGLKVPSDRVSISVHDINQDIAAYLGIDEISACDVSREDFITKYGNKIDGDKHNSLYDAVVIREIYNIIHGE